MRVRGALHIHSTLSRDGTLSIPDLVDWYRGHGYQFIAMGDHAEDLNEAKARFLSEQSAKHSNEQFLVIPGIEYACTSCIHILGAGATRLLVEQEPVAVIRGIQEQGGVAILAHPRRLGWNCPREILLTVDAVEVWNVGNDGKYLPLSRALSEIHRMFEVNPNLHAGASQDFHRKVSF